MFRMDAASGIRFFFLPVATVSKRCDHKTGRVAQIFVAVFQVGSDHSQHYIVIPPIILQL